MRELNLRQEFGGTAIGREPVRDWRFGWLTGHRTRVIAFMAFMVAILLASHLLAPAAAPPRTLLEKTVSWGSLLWLGALLPGSLGLIGTLLYQFPTDLDDASPIKRMICWRIVTSGKNIDVVLSTIRRCQGEMAKTPLAPYLIEVVIDECRNVALLPDDDVDVRVIVVPREYVTPNNSRFKARALHYALLHSQISDTTWIVHLDEETQPTQSAIKGICKFICARGSVRSLAHRPGGVALSPRMGAAPLSHTGRQCPDGRRFRQILSATSLGHYAIRTSRIFHRRSQRRPEGDRRFRFWSARRHYRGRILGYTRRCRTAGVARGSMVTWKNSLACPSLIFCASGDVGFTDW